MPRKRFIQHRSRLKTTFHWRNFRSVFCKIEGYLILQKTSFVFPAYFHLFFKFQRNYFRFLFLWIVWVYQFFLCFELFFFFCEQCELVDMNKFFEILLSSVSLINSSFLVEELSIFLDDFIRWFYCVFQSDSLIFQKIWTDNSGLVKSIFLGKSVQFTEFGHIQHKINQMQKFFYDANPSRDKWKIWLIKLTDSNMKNSLNNPAKLQPIRNC